MPRVGSLRRLTIGLSLGLIGLSCSREPFTAPTIDDAGRQLALTATTETPLFGPVLYTRDTGKPRLDTASFQAAEGDTLTVRVATTASLELNAWVEINGVRIFDTSVGRSLPDSARVVARANNSLRLWMAGKPGSNLSLTVTAPGPITPPPSQSLTILTGASVNGSNPAGEYSLAQGSTFHYVFAPALGFARLRVVLDGRLVADSGTITMDRPHWMTASADTVIVLDANETTLAQSLRAALTATMPRDAWVQFQRNLRSLSASWGAEARVHLARVYRATVDPVSDLPLLVRLDSAVSGLVEDQESSADLAMPQSDGIARSIRRSDLRARRLVDTSVGSREPTHLLVINGVFTSLDELSGTADSVAMRLAQEPIRFRGYTVSHMWNRSLAAGTVANSAVRLCVSVISAEFAMRARGDAQMRDLLASVTSCVAASGFGSLDLLEMIRWAQAAQAGDPQTDSDIDFLAQLLKSYVSDSTKKHVFVLAHSEGSLLTQLAVSRLKNVYGFNEIASQRCVGTVSVAGVGARNWPLLDRHARFVVAKHDVVTLLPGVLQNTRPVIEDSDTRAVDSLLLGVQLAEQANPSLTTRTGVGMVTLMESREIHRFNRYINSSEDWSVISAQLDSLYRTCAVGTVAVSPSTKTLQLYGSAMFGATWRAVDGQALETADTVSWTTDTLLVRTSTNGQVTAGTTAGIATLVARVRSVEDSATITVVDDSLRATYVPPVIESVVTRRQFIAWFGESGPANLAWFMSISASAMSEATITKVEVFRRLSTSPSEEFLAYSGPLPSGDFMYQSLPYNGDGTPVPWASEIFATEDFAWFRVVVTDSHGLTAEFVGSTTDPFMLP